METVLVTGYAQAPQGSSMYELYKYAGIVLEVDSRNDVIVNAEFTFVTDLAKDFFRRLLIGYDMNRGSDELIAYIKESYFAPSINSISVAVKAAFRRYEEQKSKSY